MFLQLPTMIYFMCDVSYFSIFNDVYRWFGHYYFLLKRNSRIYHLLLWMFVWFSCNGWYRIFCSSYYFQLFCLRCGASCRRVRCAYAFGRDAVDHVTFGIKEWFIWNKYIITYKSAISLQYKSRENKFCGIKLI